MEKIWPELSAILHPSDCPPPESWRRSYETKFALAKLLQPTSIFEIGVRAGYSALAFLRAVPTARYVGVDINGDQHGGFFGAIDHARRLLISFDAEIHEASSIDYAMTHEGSRQASFDLIHVDGDHSFDGCRFDLQLAHRIGYRHLLVDDYSGIQDVQSACDEFAEANDSSLVQIVIQDGHNGSILFTHDNGNIADSSERCDAMEARFTSTES
jgi:hypothetical protein